MTDPAFRRPTLRQAYELLRRRFALQRPYAHHSLGSTIAIHAMTCASIRGYPKRSAAEDFIYSTKPANRTHRNSGGPDANH